VPGIDDRHAEIVEMSHVARGERGALGQRHASDHRVAKLTHASGASTRIHQYRGFLRGYEVEWQYPLFKLFFESARECRLPFRTPPPGRHADQAGANLQHCDCRRPYGRSRLTIKPIDHNAFCVHHA